MVGTQPDLELRLELELALIQLACGHSVATCQLLEDNGVERSPARRFGCLHKPCPVQPRQVARRALGRTLSREKRLEPDCPSVVRSENGHQGFKKAGFPVSALSVAGEQQRLAPLAGQ